MPTAQTNFNLEEFLAEKKILIENHLKAVLAPKEPATQLWQAMEYSSLNGGKRLRGILCLTAADAIQMGMSSTIIPLAAAIECIHTMSLIHDDLPCMDNDDLRRGKATCHVKFNEETALIAGDALLIEGLNLLSKVELPSPKIVEIIQVVTSAVGAYGMTGGQMIDLENTNKNGVTLDELEKMHEMKTGAFLKASVLVGAIAAGANDSQVKALSKYSENIGLAFQIIDDILDLKSDSATLGKTVGKDEEQKKATYPRLLGFEVAEQKAYELVKEAKESLQNAHINSTQLCKIAEYIIERNY